MYFVITLIAFITAAMLVLLMADDLWRRGGLRTKPEDRFSCGLWLTRRPSVARTEARGVRLVALHGRSFHHGLADLAKHCVIQRFAADCAEDGAGQLIDMHTAPFVPRCTARRGGTSP
jgi:hypothetical protein